MLVRGPEYGMCNCCAMLQVHLHTRAGNLAQTWKRRPSSFARRSQKWTKLPTRICKCAGGHVLKMNHPKFAEYDPILNTTKRITRTTINHSAGNNQWHTQHAQEQTKPGTNCPSKNRKTKSKRKTTQNSENKKMNSIWNVANPIDNWCPVLFVPSHAAFPLLPPKSTPCALKQYSRLRNAADSKLRHHAEPASRLKPPAYFANELLA